MRKIVDVTVRVIVPCELTVPDARNMVDYLVDMGLNEVWGSNADNINKSDFRVGAARLVFDDCKEETNDTDK